jgi:demethylmenaquinone methyltransferase / 2-methoxy-6-polyprenyl-1,4-benzoquinol methylase
VTKADMSKKPEQVAAMFDAVAQNYDRTNDLLSFGQARLWRRALVRAVAPKPGERVLDLAAGTGTSSMALAKPGVEVIAGDFSEGMLAEGRKRHPSLEFVFADAMQLPFADQEFDAVTISFGLRNVNDHRVALTEMLRVLKPGGRVVVCEFSHVSGLLGSLYGFYLKNVLPRFSRLASSTPEAYSYLAESIAAWPNQSALAGDLRAAGFERVTHRNLSFGVVAMHSGFKPEVRS